MVMETRIRLIRCQNVLEESHDGTAPLQKGPSYVRFACALTVKHSTRRLGGGGRIVAALAAVPRFTETIQSDAAVCPVDDPSVFLDYEETRRMAWRGMVTALPGLDRYDLSPANWTTSTPDEVVATLIHHLARTYSDRAGMRGGHYRLAVFFHMEVELVFSEPDAIVDACFRVAKFFSSYTRAFHYAGKQCCVCLDDLTPTTSESGSGTTPVNLPCGHAFHSQCITIWLFEGTTCPMCRVDLRDLVHAPSFDEQVDDSLARFAQLGWRIQD